MSQIISDSDPVNMVFFNLLFLLTTVPLIGASHSNAVIKDSIDPSMENPAVIEQLIAGANHSHWKGFASFAQVGQVVAAFDYEPINIRLDLHSFVANKKLFKLALHKGIKSIKGVSNSTRVKQAVNETSKVILKEISAMDTSFSLLQSSITQAGTFNAMPSHRVISKLSPDTARHPRQIFEAILDVAAIGTSLAALYEVENLKGQVSANTRNIELNHEAIRQLSHAAAESAEEEAIIDAIESFQVKLLAALRSYTYEVAQLANDLQSLKRFHLTNNLCQKANLSKALDLLDADLVNRGKERADKGSVSFSDFPLSYQFEEELVSVMLHVPVIKANSGFPMALFRLESAALVAEDGALLEFRDHHHHFIGISGDRSKHLVFSGEELGTCRKSQRTHFCFESKVIRTRPDSCLSYLFYGTKGAERHCVKRYRQRVSSPIRVGHHTYGIHLEEAALKVCEVGNHTTEEVIQMSPKLQAVNIQPGCELTAKDFVIRVPAMRTRGVILSTNLTVAKEDLTLHFSLKSVQDRFRLSFPQVTSYSAGDIASRLFQHLPTLCLAICVIIIIYLYRSHQANRPSNLQSPGPQVIVQNKFGTPGSMCQSELERVAALSYM